MTLLTRRRLAPPRSTNLAAMTAIAALALLGTACSGEADSADDQVTTTAPAPTTTEVIAEDETLEESDDETLDFDGSFLVTYEPATFEETQREADLLQGNGILEEFADTMNESLMIPEDINVIARECDEANAFYDPEARTIELCYELPALERELFVDSDLTDEEIDEALLMSARGTLYHEAGHALISELELPITGREEDVADQLAAYMLSADEESAQHLVAIADTYWLSAGTVTDLDELAFYDEHSLDSQRATNFLCYAYGAYPDAFSHLIDDEALPEERAENCEFEFGQLADAWDVLLDPYWR